MKLIPLFVFCAVLALAVVWSEGWDGPGQGSAILTYSYDSSINVAGMYGAAEHRNAHLAAAMAWAPYADLTFSLGDPSWHRDIAMYFAPLGPAVFAAAAGPAITPGYGEPDAGKVTINTEAPWGGASGLAYFRSVVKHEFGHGLGLDHSTEPDAIMNTYAYRMMPGASDIAQLRSIYAARFAAPAPITEPGAPATSFSAFPSTVNPGFAVTLTWSAPGALSVAINEHHSLPASGTLYLYPTQPTVYTLVASNNSASASRSALVNVEAPPCTGRNCTPVALSVTASAVSSTTASEVAVTGTVTGGTAPYTITWSTTAGYSGYGYGNPYSATVPLYPGANTITVTVTDSAGSPAATATVSVTRTVDDGRAGRGS